MNIFNESISNINPTTITKEIKTKGYFCFDNADFKRTLFRTWIRGREN